MKYRMLVGALALAFVSPAFAADPAPAPERPKCECCAKMEAEGKKCDCCAEKPAAPNPGGSQGQSGHEGHTGH